MDIQLKLQQEFELKQTQVELMKEILFLLSLVIEKK